MPLYLTLICLGALSVDLDGRGFRHTFVSLASKSYRLYGAIRGCRVGALGILRAEGAESGSHVFGIGLAVSSGSTLCEDIA